MRYRSKANPTANAHYAPSRGNESTIDLETPYVMWVTIRSPR